MVPRAALDLVKRWESFARVVTLKPVPMAGPYLCPALVPTIGYGTVIASMDHPPISEPEALGKALEELHKNVDAVLRMCPVLANESENRMAALASFVYNLGAGRLQASTLRRKVNACEWPDAEHEFSKWVWAGGRKLPGLVGRRLAEAQLFAA